MCPDKGVLSAYLDGELQDRWKAVVAQHVRGCAACAAHLAGLRALGGILSADVVPGMEAARVRVRAALQAAPVRTATRRRVISVPVPLAFAAAALVMVLGAALIYAVHRGNSLTQFSASHVVVEGNLEDIHRLLDLLNAGSGGRIVTIEIPADYSFSRFGEPQFRPILQRSAE